MELLRICFFLLLLLLCVSQASSSKVTQGHFRVTKSDEVDRFKGKTVEVVSLTSVSSFIECAFGCLNFVKFHCSSFSYFKSKLKCDMVDTVLPSIDERYYMRRPECTEPFELAGEFNKCYHLAVGKWDWSDGRYHCRTLLSHPAVVESSKDGMKPLAKFYAGLKVQNADQCRARGGVSAWTAGKHCGGTSFCWQKFQDDKVLNYILSPILDLQGPEKCLKVENGEVLKAEDCDEELCVLCEKDL